MDIQTGRIYTGDAETAAARARGETLVMLADGIPRELTQAEQRAKALADRLPLQKHHEPHR